MANTLVRPFFHSASFAFYEYLFDDALKELPPGHELQHDVGVLRVLRVELVDVHHVPVHQFVQDGDLLRYKLCAVRRFEVVGRT